MRWKKLKSPGLRLIHYIRHYVHWSFLLKESIQHSMWLLHCFGAKAEISTVQVQKVENWVRN